MDEGKYLLEVILFTIQTKKNKLKKKKLESFQIHVIAEKLTGLHQRVHDMYFVLFRLCVWPSLHNLTPRIASFGKMMTSENENPS